jgi:hypothetical protein
VTLVDHSRDRDGDHEIENGCLCRFVGRSNLFLIRIPRSLLRGWKFCMKYRKNLLNDNAVNFLKHVCYEIGERYSLEFDAIGCDGDHVHLFVGAEPKYSPSRVMQIIKSITALNIFKEHPEIKK